MAQQLFVNGSKFSTPVMTLDSRDTKKRIRNAVAIFATFYVTSRLQEQFFVYDNFYLSHKS